MLCCVVLRCAVLWRDTRVRSSTCTGPAAAGVGARRGSVTSKHRVRRGSNFASGSGNGAQQRQPQQAQQVRLALSTRSHAGSIELSLSDSFRQQTAIFRLAQAWQLTAHLLVYVALRDSRCLCGGVDRRVLWCTSPERASGGWWALPPVLGLGDNSAAHHSRAQQSRELDC